MPDMTRKSHRSPPQRVARCRLVPWMPILPALLLLLSTGCIGRRGNVELLEARLRQHEDLLHRQQRTLAETRSELNIARQEADLLREQMANAGASPLPPEYTGVLFQVEDIQFNTLVTGGRDRDDVPGDEALVVVFTPYDEQGHPVKIPGRIELEAIDPHRTGEEGRQIARWTFTPAESRELWRSSLFSTGFELQVDWPGGPTSEEVLLHARLSTADGRHFDASHTIAIAPTGDTPLPGSFPAADIIQPVNHDAGRAPSAPDPLPFAVRSGPVTSLEDFLDMPEQPDDARPARPGVEPLLEAGDSGTAEPATEPTEAEEKTPTEGGAARPFPEGLRTSDVWTDETIPRLR